MKKYSSFTEMKSDIGNKKSSKQEIERRHNNLRELIEIIRKNIKTTKK